MKIAAASDVTTVHPPHLFNEFLSWTFFVNWKTASLHIKETCRFDDEYINLLVNIEKFFKQICYKNTFVYISSFNHDKYFMKQISNKIEIFNRIFAKPNIISIITFSSIYIEKLIEKLLVSIEKFFKQICYKSNFV